MGEEGWFPPPLKNFSLHAPPLSDLNIFRSGTFRSLNSRNADGGAKNAAGTAISFGEHASMGKGTYKYDGSKETFSKRLDSFLKKLCLLVKTFREIC